MKKKLDYENLRDVLWVSKPALSPDGTRAAYVCQRSDYRTGGLRPVIKEGPLPGKEEQQGTPVQSRFLPVSFLTKEQWAPAYSPNGQYLAYLSKESGTVQVWQKDLKKNTEERITHFRYDVNRFVWSPDGSRLAVETVWYPPELEPGNAGEWLSEEAIRTLKPQAQPAEDIWQERTPQEREQWEEEQARAPKVITTLIYKYDDDYGVSKPCRSGIVVLDLDSRQGSWVTPPELSFYCPSWSRDSQTLYCYGRPYQQEKERRSEIYRIQLKSGSTAQKEGLSQAAGAAEESEQKLVQVLEGGWIWKKERTIYEYPVYEQGEELIFCGITSFSDGYQIDLQAASRVDGSCRSLFPEEEVCHGVDLLSTGDHHMGDMGWPVQQDAEGKLYFLSSWQGFSGIYELNQEQPGQPGSIRLVTPPKSCILGFAAPGNGRLLYLKSDFCHPAELFCYELATGREQQISRENSWVEDYWFSRPQQLSMLCGDQKTPMNGWIYLPRGAEQTVPEQTAIEQTEAGRKVSERIPLVLDIHGGPEAYYTEGFFFEAQMLASKGLAVVVCDPRGSAGYGRAFMNEEAAWGQEAIDDYFSCLDTVLREYPQLDGDRIGVTGGSYGGYMTNKLICRTKRFRAAVAQRTFVNPATSYGTGDIGFISGSGKTDFQQYMLDRARSSMMKDIDQVEIPLLLLHGGADLRCGEEQGEQVFSMLRAIRPQLPTELVIFPGENHGVTRSGRMHNQIHHLKRLCEWMNTYLKEGMERETAETE